MPNIERQEQEQGQEPGQEEADEFQVLFLEADQQVSRLRATREPVNAAMELASMYELLRDFIGVVASVERDNDARFEELEDEELEITESVLLESDAAKYVQVFERNISVFEGMLPGLPDEQRQVVDALLRVNRDRLEFTKEITVPDPDDEEEEEEEEPEDGKDDDGEDGKTSDA